MNKLPTFDLADTIVALSSAPGGAARSIIRISGPNAWKLTPWQAPPHPPWPDSPARGRWSGLLSVAPSLPPISAEVLGFSAPRSYTGQHMVELHVPGSPPVVEELLAQLLTRGARLAGPGEFTLRAFLGGKLDLTQAEAILGLLEAEDEKTLHECLAQLAGNLAHPLRRLREELLDLLADVEAGLDFAEEDLTFLTVEEVDRRVTSAQGEMVRILAQMDRRGAVDRAYRVVLAGPPNAGKSSLFNALCGSDVALVSPEAGTTRDWLARRLTVEGIELEFIDTAGEASAADPISAQAQAGRQAAVRRADCVIYCVPAGEVPAAGDLHAPASSLVVYTKVDLAPGFAAGPATSAVTGQGLAELRGQLVRLAKASRPRSALATSLARCTAQVSTALDFLQRAREVLARRESPDLLALELRLALEKIGETIGAVHTDDLLDRIFSRFCIGK